MSLPRPAPARAGGFPENVRLVRGSCFPSILNQIRLMRQTALQRHADQAPVQDCFIKP
jgi:hypothetical protein